MIGNDIVDFDVAKKQSNWRRPRYLDKIFTEKEQYYITNSENKSQTVWRLWSMKEAAYKLYTRLNPSRFYNPKAFECRLNASAGSVRFLNFECYVESKITSDYVLSEARLIQNKITSEVLAFQDENLKNQSKHLRKKLLDSVAVDFKISRDDLHFRKDEFGIPTINFNSNKMQISLTHHGRFGAFAIA